jgi:hypothetical protein
MWRWRWLMCGVCVAALAACDESFTGPSVPLDQTFTMAPGDLVSIEKTSARVQFHGVEGDSRCPADANCIQGGDAIAPDRARRVSRHVARHALSAVTAPSSGQARLPAQ